MRKRGWLMAFVLGLMLSMFLSGTKIFAKSISIQEIDYEAQTITVKSDGSDQLLYFSDGKQKTWEAAYGEWKDSVFTMDISFVNPKKAYTLSIKGNASTTPVVVKLPAQKSNFSASINTIESSVSFSNQGEAASVEWRKSVSGCVSSQWTTYDATSFGKELETLALKGATLYFRTVQVKGNASNPGVRPSKEVKVTVSRRAAAPSVTVDGSTLQLKGKTTMEYKKSSEDKWKGFTNANVNLRDIVPEVLLGDGENASASEASIDVRTKQTTSKVASQVKSVKIAAQERTPNNFEFSYISQSKCGFSLTAVDKDKKESIPAPSSSNAYEYTIVKAGSVLDEATAKWTAITGTSQITITSTNAPKGSVIYYRKKASTADGKTVLSTKPRGIQIGSYPTAATVSAVTLRKIQGLDTALTFSVRTPVDNTVSSVVFNGCATEFTTTTAKETTDVDGVRYQLVTVTINSTSKVEAVSSNLGKELIASITLSSGETINSGVSLTILPKTVLASGSESKLFSWQGVDAGEYGITTKNTFKLYTANTEGNDPAIVSINIGGYKVGAGSIGSVVDGYQTVTLSTDDVKALGEKLNPNVEYDVVINLKNKEKITGIVSYTVKSVATVTSASSGFGFAKNTYKEYNAVSGTGIKNPVVTLTINSEADNMIGGLYFDSVKWGPAGKQIDILDGMETNKLVTSITLNLKTIKESDISGSYPVCFVFKDRNDHQYVISKGYTLTCS